jgi:hypothetical protein
VVRWIAAFVMTMAAAVLAPDEAVAQTKGGKKPPPPAVSAEFRSASPDLFAGDTLAGDGSVYPPYNGAEGAFINSNGGLTIALQGATPDRSMWFNFSGTPVTDYGTCHRSWYFATLESTNVTLQMNDGTSTTAVGLTNLAVGRAYFGFGKINFDSGVPGDPYFWTLRFPAQSLKVTRVSTTQWTIEWAPATSSISATLQCTTNKKPTVIADDSEWVMPFMITVNQVVK